MTSRTALALALLTLSAVPAQAEIRIGDVVYPEAERDAVAASCRGLEAEARQSLTSNPPDDIPSGDPASAWALSDLPFTVADCRRAGFR